jgi:hypothetical protein
MTTDTLTPEAILHEAITTDESRKRNGKFLLRGCAPRYNSLKGKNKNQRARLRSAFAGSRPDFKFQFFNTGDGKYARGASGQKTKNRR